MVQQPKHEGASSGSVPDSVRRPVGLGFTWPDEDHLPLEGQEQDPAQETVEPVHVHVLLLG